MKTVMYQGYTIKSFPQRGKTFDAWTISLEIVWQHNGAPMTQSVTADTPYVTEGEADLHGITHAQRLIEGKGSGMSVA